MFFDELQKGFMRLLGDHQARYLLNLYCAENMNYSLLENILNHSLQNKLQQLIKKRKKRRLYDLKTVLVQVEQE